MSSASFIIYTTNFKYVDKTIDDLLDHTPPDLIKEILVCNDFKAKYERENVKICQFAGIGRAKAWNRAFQESTGDIVVFLNGAIKFSQDWIVDILEVLKEEPSSLVSPTIHALDLEFWSSEPRRWKRFGFRWNLELYDRQTSGRSDSPAISACCIAANREWFINVGQFDDGMTVGAGEDLELSIRNWLLGGNIFITDSIISCFSDAEATSLVNLGRTATWFDKYAKYFYEARKIDPTKLDVGRLANYTESKKKQIRDFDWYVSEHLPELGKIYSLAGVASKKKVAVVGNGASLDFIDTSVINSHDIIIGVDYIGTIFDCDYVLTHIDKIVLELRAKYSADKFVLPLNLINHTTGEYVSADSLVKNCNQFELNNYTSILTAAGPPFHNFNSDSLIFAAIHFALFLDPISVTVFGCDNKFVWGKSHTSKIEYYNDGKVLTDSESTRKRWAQNEFALDNLGRLSQLLNIPVLRVTHA